MKMKKVKAVLAAFALIAMMPFQVMAADGSIMFSDLTEETGRSVKTGETAEIKFAVASTAGAIGEANVTLTYDASALQFEGAEGVTEGSEKGSLVYTGKGDGTAAELRTTLKFKVLKAGDLSIHVASYQVTSSVGAQLTEVETEVLQSQHFQGRQRWQSKLAANSKDRRQEKQLRFQIHTRSRFSQKSRIQNCRRIM